jgi:hypothetical protein
MSDDPQQEYFSNAITEDEMGVGPQEHFDIIDNTFKKCVKQGLRRAFWGAKTHI